MNPKTITCFALALGAVTTFTVAQDEEKTVQTPEEPVIVSDYQPPGSEAQIVIRPGEEDEVFYEYRVGGELKEIKVVPKVGPEYYLVPAEGGGWIRENETDLLVPSWVLFRW